MKSAEENKVMPLNEDALLQMEIFTWQTREDIWSGLTDENSRRELSQRCQIDFEPTLLPSERSLDKLRDFLEDLSASLEKSEWAYSGNQLEVDGETPYRLNALMAFHLQLRWICDVFQNSPGTSVSVR